VFNNANKKGEYVQTRDRMTFKKGSIQIDLTYLPDSKGSQYQVEIEFTGKAEACKHIELVSELLDDVRVKGIVFSQYRDLLGNRFAGPLPQTLTKEAFDKRILTKNKYSVTEKADGERFLLFVDRVGGLNLISRGLDITRWKVGNKPDYANTVLDGEYVGDTFYAFDILYLKGKDLRQQTLKPRLKALESVNMGSKIKMKRFIVDENIYKAAGKIWDKKGNFPYELDGLIFTPVDEPYCGRMKTQLTFFTTENNFLLPVSTRPKVITRCFRSVELTARVPFTQNPKRLPMTFSRTRVLRRMSGRAYLPLRSRVLLW
jgi:ATP-dependent DNA ligase